LLNGKAMVQTVSVIAFKGDVNSNQT